MSGARDTALASIALPVHNGGLGLARVVESVLAQSHSDLELVISDNASTDETQEICRRLPPATDVWSTSGNPPTSACSTTTSARRSLPG